MNSAHVCILKLNKHQTNFVDVTCLHQSKAEPLSPVRANTFDSAHKVVMNIHRLRGASRNGK